MTLAEIEALTTDTITCKQAASVLRSNEQLLRITAREMPERLPFPVIVIGSRVKIPKAAFVSFMRGAR